MQYRLINDLDGVLPRDVGSGGRPRIARGQEARIPREADGLAKVNRPTDHCVWSGLR